MTPASISGALFDCLLSHCKKKNRWHCVLVNRVWAEAPGSKGHAKGKCISWWAFKKSVWVQISWKAHLSLILLLKWQSDLSSGYCSRGPLIWFGGRCRQKLVQVKLSKILSALQFTPSGSKEDWGHIRQPLMGPTKGVSLWLYRCGQKDFVSLHNKMKAGRPWTQIEFPGLVTQLLTWCHPIVTRLNALAAAQILLAPSSLLTQWSQRVGMALVGVMGVFDP